MHKLAVVLGVYVSLFLPSAMAQSPAGMSEEKMQQMMQGMMGMANCFQGLEGDLEVVAEKSKQKQQEIEQLCAADKRDEAQQAAMAFGLEMASSDTFKKMQQCGEMAKGMMPEIPDYSVYDTATGSDEPSRHVCDDR